MGKSKDISYSDKAREIMNRYKRRLGDDFSKKDKLAEESMNRELEMLKQEQESVRSKMMSNEQGLPMGAKGIDLTKDIKYNPNEYSAEQEDLERAAYLASQTTGLTKPFSQSERNTIFPEEAYTPVTGDLPTPSELRNPGDRPYTTSVSPLGMLPSLIGYGLNRRAIKDMKGNQYTPSSISPERISLAGERSASQARGRERSNMLKRMGYSISPSQRYARTLAGITESDRITGEEIGKSYMNEGNTNAQFSQRAKEFNAQEASRARSYGLDNRNRIAQMRLANNQGLVSGLSGYMRDVMMANQYDKALAASTENYNLVTPGSYYERPLSGRILDYFTMRKPYETRVRNSSRQY